MKNKFLLGLFGYNSEAGTSLSNHPKKWNAKWEFILKLTTHLDTNGYDFILPLMRWVSYGGKSNARNLCFETISFISLLTSITKKINLISTLHGLYIHPVYAARAISTIDIASRGRVGINYVAGWNKNELEMFGIKNLVNDQRYDYSTEWIKIFEKCIYEKKDFNHKGKFFNLNGIHCNPKSYQNRKIPFFSASFSPEGRNFAINYFDFLLTTFSNPEKLKFQIKKIRSEKKSFKIISPCSIFLKKTFYQAEKYYNEVTEKYIDRSAIKSFIDSKKIKNEVVSFYQKKAEKKLAAGFGSYPIIGSPDDVIDQIRVLKKNGLNGIALSFIDYYKDVKFFSKYIKNKI